MSPIRINRRTGVKMSNKVAILAIVLVVAQTAFMFYIFVYKDNQVETLRRDADALKARLEMLEKERDDLREQLKIQKIIEDLNSGLPPEQAGRIGRTVWEESRRHQCSPLLIMAIIITESSIRPEATSPRNAFGLMQVLPEVGMSLAEDVARRLPPEELDALGLRLPNERALYDPETNIRIGMLYFAQLLDRFDGDLHLAIRAYNAGPTAVSRTLREGGSLPEGYLNRVLGRYRMLRDKYGPDRLKGA